MGGVYKRESWKNEVTPTLRKSSKRRPLREDPPRQVAQYTRELHSPSKRQKKRRRPETPEAGTPNRVGRESSSTELTGSRRECTDRSWANGDGKKLNVSQHAPKEVPDDLKI